MPKKDAVPAVPMRVLKIDTCPSLSGRSELTYHIGCNADGDIQFRVVANTSAGQFNDDWVALSLIQSMLSATKPVTSSALRRVFMHRSCNSPGFLFAALKAESLVLPGEDLDSGYIVGDIEGFKLAMSALIASDTNLEVAVAASPEAPKRKSGKDSA